MQYVFIIKRGADVRSATEARYAVTDEGNTFANNVRGVRSVNMVRKDAGVVAAKEVHFVDTANCDNPVLFALHIVVVSIVTTSMLILILVSNPTVSAVTVSLIPTKNFLINIK